MTVIHVGLLDGIGKYMFGIRTGPHRALSEGRVELIGLLALVALVFAFGGSARPDEVGVVILRPLSVLGLFLALIYIRKDHFQANKFVILWASMVVLMAFLHLVPLPPQLFSHSTGQGHVQQIFAELGQPKVWRPLSVSPELTRNAVWSLAAPLACYLLAIQLNNRQIFIVIFVILLLAMFSGLIAVLQMSQGVGSGFYRYNVTNLGSGVGLFANRNHHAVLLSTMIPVVYGLTIIADSQNRLSNMPRRNIFAGWMGILSSIFIMMLIVVTGSRSGVALSIVALIIVWYFDRLRGSANKQKSSQGAGRRGVAARMLYKHRYFAFALCVIVIPVTIVIISGQDLAIRRLYDFNSEEKSRADILPTVQQMVFDFLPLGSGIGTFEPVFRMYEPYELLAPGYWNHAHNDWLEVIITAGIPGVILMLSGLFWLFKCCSEISRKAKVDSEAGAFGLIGLSIVAICSISSIFDYPLRAPIMACFFMVGIDLIGRATEKYRLQRR